jgi:hypothetical protein
MVMIQSYRTDLRIAAAVLCASIASSACADPPTIEGVWQQVDSGSGYVGGLISFKEKGDCGQDISSRCIQSRGIR